MGGTVGSEERGTTKPLTGTVFYVLLALADGERYGLGIVQEIESRTAGDVQLGPGTLYNAIKKMLARGLIEETHGPNASVDDDPRRRYYRITADGREAFEAEAQRLERLVGAVNAKRTVPAKQ